LSVTAPPGPPRVDESVDFEALEALIKEARRRARRRRMLYATAALLTGLAAFAAYAALGGGGGGGPAPPRSGEPSAGVHVAQVTPKYRNGALTIMDIEAQNHSGPPGWYAFSTLDEDGGLHVLVRCPQRATWCGEIESIDWSPDGRRLAFGVSSVGLANPYNGLRMFDQVSGTDRLVLKPSDSPREYDWFDIDWAPDAKRLAYVSGGRISLVNVDGTGRTLLQTGTVGRDHSPSWSPDGAWIAYATRDGYSSVYVIRPDGSQRTLLARHASAPAWSPDGQRIAFVRDGGIVFATPSGRVLPPRPPYRAGVPVGIAGAPVWSPDGTKIAMANQSGTYVMNADGTALVRITSKSLGVWMGQPPRPAWRPRP
jgi:dipeptidyl aminopeptidase/acylaminoacyl peptidase